MRPLVKRQDAGWKHVGRQRRQKHTKWPGSQSKVQELSAEIFEMVGFYQINFFFSLSEGWAENCIFAQQKYKTLLLQFPFLILLSVFYTRLFTATETVAGRRNAEQWCIKLPPHHTTPQCTAPLPPNPPPTLPGVEGRGLSLAHWWHSDPS